MDDQGQSTPLQEGVEDWGTQQIELAPKTNYENNTESSVPIPQTEEDDGPNEEGKEMNQCGCCSCVSTSWNPAEIRVECGGRTYLRFNWITMALSVSVIWAFVIWAIADPNAGVEIGLWQTWIVKNFAWLYSFCLAMFMGFMLYIMFSPYGDIKLAASDDEEPDFSYATWFSMLFSAGIAIGIFFFGVGEPVFHFREAVDGKNRWGNLGLNEQATAALNLTWFHWGFSASSVYAIVGLPLAYFGHRKKLPMTIRTTFYALLGEDVNGVIGDVVDSLAVIGTMFGVATSLGIGIIQLNAGMHRVTGMRDSLGNKLSILWIVTAVATISVMTGLKVGIRRLSEVNFLLGLIIVLFLFFIGNSVFQLDLFVETIGFHIQWLPKLLLRVDAWERNGYNAAGYPNVYDKVPNITDPEGWMAGWSTFYWAWWVAWSPFVGLFIASISKGRTIREFILGNMIVPTVMTCIILTVFGGLGLDIEMKSYLAGYTCSDTAPMGVIGPNGETNIPPELMRISCRAFADSFFDVVDAYPLSGLMSVVSIITMTTYFVTSSDSASHVIDVITSNGYHEPPIIQRVFWALMEGAVASALLVAGGQAALSALQTASIAAGLPLTFVLIGMMFSMKKALEEEMSGRNTPVVTATTIKAIPEEPEEPLLFGDPHLHAAAALSVTDDVAKVMSHSGMSMEEQTGFSSPNFRNDRTWSVSLCSVCWKYPVETLVAFFFPCGVQIKTQRETDLYEDGKSRACLGINLVLPTILVVVFGSLGTVNRGFYALAGIAALTFYGLSVRYRMGLRETYGVDGGILEDMGAYCCCYGCAIAQEHQLVQDGVKLVAQPAKQI